LQQVVDNSDAICRLAAAASPAQARMVAPAVEALLAAALDVDGGRFLSLYAFVRALRQQPIKAPAGLATGAVQLLTIHGAKGLEAHTVFVMDTDPERQAAELSTLLADWPVDSPAPRRLAFVANVSRAPLDWLAHVQAELDARAREEANALYVAMTRAEAELVFSRTEPYNKSADVSWWQRVQSVVCKDETQAQAPQPVSASRSEVLVPHWPPSVPMAQDGLAPSASDDTAQLGRAVHRALEWATQSALAQERLPLLCVAAARAFTLRDADEVHRIARQILSSPDCACFFDAAQLAWAGNEVPVRGEAGEVLRIDRLVRLREAGKPWWVLDYKLSGDPLQSPELIGQLRGYQRAVQLAEPQAMVRCGFITQSGKLLELKGEGDEP
jgi:ATP-dependent helicase/nuclease subunit A